MNGFVPLFYMAPPQNRSDERYKMHKRHFFDIFPHGYTSPRNIPSLVQGLKAERFFRIVKKYD